MKNVTILSLIIALTSISVHAQFGWGNSIKGNGHIVTVKQKTADYDKISVGGSFDIYLTQGNEGNLEIAIEENLVEYLDITSKNGKLNIEWRKNANISHSKGVKVYVPIENISDLTVTGSGSIRNDFTLQEPTLSLSVVGSGDIFLQANTKSLTAHVIGSGDINLTGKTNDLSAKVTGSGDFNGNNLQAENAAATVSGSGTIEVMVTDTFDGKVSGSGDIFYKGNPKTDHISVVGSGSIKMK